VLKRYIHLGIAVDTPRGLLVPVIRDADRKGLASIAAELTELAERARSGKLAVAEMQGGTFTITNLGGLGTTAFTPIVRWPEVAILGVGRAEELAVFDGGTFVPRKVLPLCLSYDHRAVDGADAARFLRALAEMLENPLRAAFE
jgi:pyruvate dehydrogenase E2 component (dihydrolipoamide acetyltransferase)